MNRKLGVTIKYEISEELIQELQKVTRDANLESEVIAALIDLYEESK